jgi:hypothetical protein
MMTYNSTTSEVNYTTTVTVDQTNQRVGINCNVPQNALDVTGNAYVSGTLTQGSDRRIKTDIVPITSALEKIQQLTGVYYKNITIDTDLRKMGFIAQDIEQVVPEVVRTDTSEEEFKSVAYQDLTALLVEGIKESQAQVSTLQANFQTLFNQNSTLQGMFQTLSTTV